MKFLENVLSMRSFLKAFAESQILVVTIALKAVSQFESLGTAQTMRHYGDHSASRLASYFFVPLAGSKYFKN